MTDKMETHPPRLAQPFAWQERNDLIDFCKLLDGNAGSGTNARLVGGVVRDALLGVQAADIDLATKLLPQNVMRIAKSAGLSAIPTGIAHGTVTVVLAQGTVEVTTLRRDVSTDGRHATIVFSDDWQEDAARRDFTFNAFYAVPENGALYDYFDGQNDLDAGIVRFIGDARERINEDYLRIMRYFRFHARYGQGPLDQSTLALCAELAPRLQGLSRERIAQELLRLIMMPEPISTMKAMQDAGIWEFIIPEINKEGIERLEETLQRGRAENITVIAMSRLAALLASGKDVPAKVAAALRLSRKQQKTLTLLCSSDAQQADDIVSLAYFHGSEMALQIALLKGSQSALHTAKHYLAGWIKPVFPIGGRDIINAGVEPGPQISALLQKGEKQWLKQNCPEINDIPDYIAKFISNENIRQ
ncbi:CCA tRNA nucleotidyltransferase [Parasphingorhabdus sp. DH2-15]|uniref:CCA tRNA nucleotidyltransferase n=1 Tax=Parasphingorhabdus sp. DH2-15 TaxID=3444112 RepID=UPI003F686AF9